MPDAPDTIPTRTIACWNDAIESLLATAHWLFARGHYRHAESAFRAALLYAWRDERAWLGFGACREASGAPRAALAIYGAARTVCVPGVRIHLARARLLRTLGHAEEADEALAAAEETARSSHDAWLRDLVRAERASVDGPKAPASGAGGRG